MGPTDPGAPYDSADHFAQECADLTPAQLRAVTSTAGALCIVAGAGSGKTRVLTMRVARRIRDGSADADHTVVATFTRKAAGELRERLGRYGVPVSVPAGPGGVPTPGVRAGTLHQLALTLLRRRAADTGQPPPSLVEQRWRTLAEVAGDGAVASAVDTEIGWAKARCLSPDAYPAASAAAGRVAGLAPERVAELFTAYETRLVRRGQLDLDDVLLRAADLVTDDDAFGARVRWRYRHVAVDEFQDVNPAQFRLLEALVGDRGDLCAVGDPNQAIYGWNGADPTLLATLPDRIVGLEVVHLDRNHRCTPQVVAAAGAALGPTAFTPPVSAADDGPLPTVTAFDDDRAEADAVAARILARAEAGLSWGEQAVLARTHDQLARVRRALEASGIPCRFAPGPESADAEVPGPATGRAAGVRRSSGRPDPGGGVELATFHRAKGLEWEAVSVVGLEEGYVPIVHATTPATLDEERRLLYVALTRASRVLECSWARTRTMRGAGRARERQASPWLADIAVVTVAGSGPPSPVAAAERFAGLRAHLRG